MSEESASGQAVAERVRAANIAVGDGDGVEAMLANSLRERKPLADTGKLYNSVQSAVSAAGSFVFVPPGTFNESVTIDTAGLTLLGSGNASIIDGGTSGPPITISSQNVTVEKVKLQRSGASSGNWIDNNSSNTIFDTITVIGAGDASGSANLYLGDDSKLVNSRVLDVAGYAVRPGTRTIISGCYIRSAECTVSDHSRAITNADDDVIVTNNIIESDPADGFGIQLNNFGDCIVIGNRFIGNGSPDTGIKISSNAPDCIVANNRVSDYGTNINNDAGSTTLDGNLTGASN